MAETARIAIVDDDRWMRRSLERLLKSAGLRSEGFTSPEDYLDGGNHDGIACIILDIGLPGMSGFQLERRLAAEPNRMPVLFVSASDEPEIRYQAAQSGAVAFLQAIRRRRAAQCCSHSSPIIERNNKVSFSCLASAFAQM